MYYYLHWPVISHTSPSDPGGKPLEICSIIIVPRHWSTSVTNFIALIMQWQLLEPASDNWSLTTSVITFSGCLMDNHYLGFWFIGDFSLGKSAWWRGILGHKICRATKPCTYTIFYKINALCLIMFICEICWVKSYNRKPVKLTLASSSCWKVQVQLLRYVQGVNRYTYFISYRLIWLKLYVIKCIYCNLFDI